MDESIDQAKVSEVKSELYSLSTKDIRVEPQVTPQRFTEK